MTDPRNRSITPNVTENVSSQDYIVPRIVNVFVQRSQALLIRQLLDTDLAMAEADI
jgi:hypothetical protein